MATFLALPRTRFPIAGSVTAWGYALAAGVGGSAVAAEIALWDQRPLPWAALRGGLAAAWLTYLALVLLSEARRLVEAHRTQASSSSPAPEDQRLAAACGAQLPWSEVIRRAALVAAVPLPRYLADPAGGSVVAVWLLMILCCGFVYLEHACLGRPGRERWLRRYWVAAALFLLPWAIPACSAH